MVAILKTTPISLEGVVSKFKMEDSLNSAKRKALQSSVAALCVENGYLSSDRGAIEVLTQILQGCELLNV